MLTRRMFLKTTVAAAAVVAARHVAFAAAGVVVGHSVKCIGHLLAGGVEVEAVEVVYLSPAIMGERFWAAVAEQAPHATLTADHRRRVTAWLDAGVIRPSPPGLGPTGRKIWTRDGLPYWLPGLYGARLPDVIASYERLA